MKRKISRLGLITILMLLILSLNVSAISEIPYQAYNYDYWGNVYYTPAAYVPAGNITGEALGIGTLKNPQDLYVGEDGKTYIADTENNRIIVLNDKLKLENIIDSFDNNGTPDSFKSPSGVFVTRNHELYIADTSNLRVVALNPDGSLKRIIKDPKSEILDDNFVFAPLKVAVDYADRVFVVAKNMFQGIMAFDEMGNFTGFTGTIKVTISLTEKIWRRLSTRSQRSRQLQYIPTEFTNLDIAPDGFIYATNVDTEAQQSIRRLNPKGQDVIKKQKDGTLSGDQYWRRGREYSGPSRIVDIIYRGSGIYTVLDSVRGRIFTYDHEGNLLYIFGGMGTQEGTFRRPVAIDVKDDKLIVLDAYLGEIVTFSATRYGQMIDEAVSLRFSGDEASAVLRWQEVLKMDSNCELAYSGIGKSYLAAGENKKAMEYLRLAMDKEYYSIAFKRYRDEILKENLSYILTGIVVIVIALMVRSALRKAKRKGATASE